MGAHPEAAPRPAPASSRPQTGGGRGPTARASRPRPGPAPPPSPPPARPSPAAASAARPHSARLGVPAAAPGPRLASGGGTLPAPLRDELGGRSGLPARGVSARRGRPRGGGGRGARPPPRLRPALRLPALPPGPGPGAPPGLRESPPPPGSGEGAADARVRGVEAPGILGRSLPSGSQLYHGAVVTATSEPPSSPRGVYTCGGLCYFTSVTVEETEA